MPDIPEPWATAMVDRGFTDRRTKVPRPSARALADAAGVHATTVLAMIGGAASDPRSVQAVADALGQRPETVSGWIDPARIVRDPWVPPDEVHLLDRRQRDALTELIRAMAHRSDHGSAAATIRAEGSSASKFIVSDPVVVSGAEEPRAVPRQQPPRGSRRRPRE